MKYNIRDVATEMGIQQRLAKFPVPAQIWDEYHQDQEINDRGVCLDMNLVAAAVDTAARDEQITICTVELKSGVSIDVDA